MRGNIYTKIYLEIYFSNYHLNNIHKNNMHAVFIYLRK